MSQLCFQSNEFTGLVLLAAVLIVSPLAAAYVLVAAALAPAGRMLLGQRGPALAAGLPGLNPCLAALALPAFFQTAWSDIWMWLVLIGCVAATVVLVHVLVAILPFPILTLPFVIVFWTVYALAPHSSVLEAKPSGSAVPADFQLILATLSSLGEVVFAPSAWSGLLVLAGILVSNRRHAVVAVVGAVIGACVPYYYHSADPVSSDLGLYGFNGVVTAVAVYVLCGSDVRLAILGALVATIMLPAIAQLGIPPVTAPLVLSTWLLLMIGWLDQRLFAPPPHRNGEPDAPTR